ncbi:MAG TPA: cation:proton antiporter [Euryarchaeota archaeon]|nr:MAG: cation:proton antiporter [Thermoplasmatales archaeon ex4484_6]RLF69141.1 MAG: cation:proton antiporter [Thermoplasmata archaeon]HHD15858.1 cation:proton antiporter [Euryarchaeota archaeon]
MLSNIPYLVVVALMVIGLYIILFKRNLIKLAMGITLLETGVNLFLITLAYRHGEVLHAPVFTSMILRNDTTFSLPTPHALTLTSIVIGVATTALLLTFFMQLYRKFKVSTTDDLRRLRG